MVVAIPLEEGVAWNHLGFVDGEITKHSWWDILVATIAHDHSFASDSHDAVSLEIVGLNNKIAIRQDSDS